MRELIAEIRLLVASRNRKALRAALYALDDFQLLEENIPSEVFDTYVWLLSNGDAISAPGVDKVFVNFTGDIKFARTDLEADLSH